MHYKVQHISSAVWALMCFQLPCAFSQNELLSSFPNKQHTDEDLFGNIKQGNYQEAEDRDGRIFSFSTGKTKIQVDLAFGIPFLHIPIGKTDNGALVDIDLGALAAGGIFSAAALIFIPHIFTGLSPEISFARSENGASSSVLSRLDNALLDYNIDSVACTQRAICWAVNTSVSEILSGRGASFDKIVDGITSANFFNYLVNGTSLSEAVQSGKSGQDCSRLYSNCPITQKMLEMVSRKILPSGLPSIYL